MSRKSFKSVTKNSLEAQREYVVPGVKKPTLQGTKPVNTEISGVYQIVGPGSVPVNDFPYSPYNDDELNGGNYESNESGSFLSHVKRVNMIAWGGIVFLAILIGLTVYVIAKQ